MTSNASDVKVSTRLTQIYREVEPAPDTDFWPISDSDGTQYILFNTKEGNVCYYREDSEGFLRFSLGVNGTIVAVAASPVKNAHSSLRYDSAALLEIKISTGDIKHYQVYASEKLLKCSPVLVNEADTIDNVNLVSLGTTSNFCNKDGASATLYNQISRLYTLKMLAHGNSDGHVYNYSFSEQQFNRTPLAPLVFPDGTEGKSLSMAAHVFDCKPLPFGNVFRLATYVCYSKNADKPGCCEALAYWHFPTNYYPCEIVKAIPITFDRQSNYVLFLISHAYRYRLLVCHYNPGLYNIHNFTELDIEQFQNITSLDAQPTMRNDLKYISLTLTDKTYPDRVYHCYYDVHDKMKYIQTAFIPILQNVCSYKNCVNAQKEHIIYYTTKDEQNTSILRRLSFDQVADEWVEETLLSGAEKGLAPVTAYEHIVKASDENGIPMRFATAKIWSNLHTTIETANEFVHIGPDKTATVQTDEMGVLHIYHETHSISDEDIYVEIMSNAGAIKQTLSAAEYQKKRFEVLDMKKLRDATDSEGNYILSEERRKDETTLINITNSIRDLANGKKPNGLFLSGSQGFCLTLNDDGSVSRNELRAGEYDMFRNQALLQPNGLFSKIADFFKGVYKGIVKVVKIVVDVTPTVIKNLVTFVVDGIKRTIEFALDTARKIINSIETVFSLVLDLLQPFFDWLGDLLGLGGIKRTQSAIKFMFEQSTNLISSKAVEYKKQMKQSLAAVAEKVDEEVDKICKTLGNETTGSLQARQQSISNSHGNLSITENYIMDAVIRNAHAFVFSDDFLEEINTPLENLWAYLSQLSDRVQNEENFVEALEYLKSISKSKDSFMNNSLAAFLKAMTGIFKLAVSLLSDASEYIFDLATQCVQAILATFSAKIQIPFLTTLFKTAFAQDLTLLNLLSMLIAMPTNILMKVLKDRVPFKNNAELEDFKRKCRAQMSESQTENQDKLDKDTTIFLSLVCYACQTAAYHSTLLSDLKSSYVLVDEKPAVFFDKIALGANVVWIFAGLPSLYGVKDPVSEWGLSISCMLGALVSFVAIKCNEPTSSTQNGKIGDTVLAVIQGILGVSYLFFNIWGWVKKGVQDIFGLINQLVISIQSVGRFLMIPALILVSGGATLIIEWFLDLFADIMGVVGFLIETLSQRSFAI